MYFWRLDRRRSQWWGKKHLTEDPKLSEHRHQKSRISRVEKGSSLDGGKVPWWFWCSMEQGVHLVNMFWMLLLHSMDPDHRNSLLQFEFYRSPLAQDRLFGLNYASEVQWDPKEEKSLSISRLISRQCHKHNHLYWLLMRQYNTVWYQLLYFWIFQLNANHPYAHFHDYLLRIRAILSREIGFDLLEICRDSTGGVLEGVICWGTELDELDNSEIKQVKRRSLFLYIELTGDPIL